MDSAKFEVLCKQIVMDYAKVTKMKYILMPTRSLKTRK